MPLGDIYRTFAKRSTDIRPAARRIHGVLLHWQRNVHVPPEKRLGPSIANPSHGEHVFRVAPNEIAFGTRVPYSMAHYWHLVKSGQMPHLFLSPQAAKDIGSVIGEFIMGGKT